MCIDLGVLKLKEVSLIYFIIKFEWVGIFCVESFIIFFIDIVCIVVLSVSVMLVCVMLIYVFVYLIKFIFVEFF